MALNLDQLFAGHLHALQLGNRRMEMLAANIANADTPGYLARDIDFRAAMNNAAGNGIDGALTLQATQRGHLNGADARQSRPATYRERGNLIAAARMLRPRQDPPYALRPPARLDPFRSKSNASAGDWSSSTAKKYARFDERKCGNGAWSGY